jgi:hypothetical protein
LGLGWVGQCELSRPGYVQAGLGAITGLERANVHRTPLYGGLMDVRVGGAVGSLAPTQPCHACGAAPAEQEQRTQELQLAKGTGEPAAGRARSAPGRRALVIALAVERPLDLAGHPRPEPLD